MARRKTAWRSFVMVAGKKNNGIFSWGTGSGYSAPLAFVLGSVLAAVLVRALDDAISETSEDVRIDQYGRPWKMFSMQDWAEVLPTKSPSTVRRIVKSVISLKAVYATECKGGRSKAPYYTIDYGMLEAQEEAAVRALAGTKGAVPDAKLVEYGLKHEGYGLDIFVDVPPFGSGKENEVDSATEPHEITVPVQDDDATEEPMENSEPPENDGSEKHACNDEDSDDFQDDDEISEEDLLPKEERWRYSLPYGPYGDENHLASGIPRNKEQVAAICKRYPELRTPPKSSEEFHEKYSLLLKASRELAEERKSAEEQKRNEEHLRKVHERYELTMKQIAESPDDGIDPKEAMRKSIAQRNDPEYDFIPPRLLAYFEDRWESLEKTNKEEIEEAEACPDSFVSFDESPDCPPSGDAVEIDEEAYGQSLDFQTEDDGSDAEDEEDLLPFFDNSYEREQEYLTLEGEDFDPFPFDGEPEDREASGSEKGRFPKSPEKENELANLFQQRLRPLMKAEEIEDLKIFIHDFPERLFRYAVDSAARKDARRNPFPYMRKILSSEIEKNPGKWASNEQLGRKKHGENVWLTDEEYEKLSKIFRGSFFADHRIENLDKYKAKSGKEYDSDYEAILRSAGIKDEDGAVKKAEEDAAMEKEVEASVKASEERTKNLVKKFMEEAKETVKKKREEEADRKRRLELLDEKQAEWARKYAKDRTPTQADWALYPTLETVR